MKRVRVRNKVIELNYYKKCCHALKKKGVSLPLTSSLIE
jgi:hypothetical protein